MCHNHSHAVVELIAVVVIGETNHAVFGLPRPLKLEVLGGQTLTLPAGSIFLTPFSPREGSVRFPALETEALFACVESLGLMFVEGTAIAPSKLSELLSR